MARDTSNRIDLSPPSPLWVIATLVALCFLCFIVLFDDLGDAALFEPDEGRNAEVAREILLTGDWVTPHYDFMPVLDKPIFFYWSIALSYKLFGVSEWSARFPSALAALGCVLLVCWFARTLWGHWEGLWSGLILLTGAEYFVLARTVIFDMTFTFFVTLSLCAFYLGANAASRRKGMSFLLMYAAMGCATLVKGPLGVILPGMVIFAYLLARHQWHVLGEMRPVTGIALFLLITAPWYIAVEARNPGYLWYFLREEHFLRFWTPHFHRTGAWYMFLLVLAAGFFPWTLLLPRIRWQRFREDKTLFLILWAVLPFVFFSLSNSKMPHYILPIFPAISILAGDASAVLMKDQMGKGRYLPSILGVSMILLLLPIALAAAWPDLLPSAIRASLQPLPDTIRSFFPKLLAVLFLLTVAFVILITRPLKQGPQYLLCCGALSVFFYFIQDISVPVSLNRMPKTFLQRSADLIGSTDQVVIYDAYLTGLPFYLKINRPIWLVWPGHARSIMGSSFLARKQLQRSPDYGKTLFTPQEFSALWRGSRQRLMVFVREKYFDRIAEDTGAPPKTLLKEGSLLLVTNQ